MLTLLLVVIVFLAFPRLVLDAIAVIMIGGVLLVLLLPLALLLLVVVAA